MQLWISSGQGICHIPLKVRLVQVLILPLLCGLNCLTLSAFLHLNVSCLAFPSEALQKLLRP